MAVSDHIKDITPDISALDKRDQAVAEFMQLRNHPAWRRVQDILNQKIIELEKAVLDSDVHGNELNRLRDRRDLALWFLNIPDIFIEELQKVEPTEPMVFDPYEERKMPTEPTEQLTR